MPPGAVLGPQMLPQPPAMMPNPAFQQWMQVKQAWDAETQHRQQQFMAACTLLKEDAAKSYKIDIEADSTVAADEQAEKQSRTEFLQAMTPFLEGMVPIMQQSPSLAPLISELIMFGVRAFPTSRSLEDAFETALEKMQQAPPVPPAQKGNAKSPMEIQAEAQEAQGKLQTAQQSNQVKLQTDQQANAVKLQQMQTEAQIQREKLQAQQDKDAAELAMRGREMQGREQLEQAKIEHMQTRDTAGLV